MKSLSMASKVVGAIATAAMLTAALPFAANAQNSVHFGTPYGGEDTLQELLDELDADIDTSEESGVELFQPIGKADREITRAFLLFEIAGNASGNAFGLYNSDGDKKEIFAGGDSGFDRSDKFSVDDLIAEGFGTFGLYLQDPNGNFFYSEAVKNNGNDQFLAYQGSGQDIQKPGKADGNTFKLTNKDYLFAFEDLPLANSDKDYNDFVGVIRRVTAVESVPEPTAMVGLAAVAGGALAMRRRRQNA